MPTNSGESKAGGTRLWGHRGTAAILTWGHPGGDGGRGGHAGTRIAVAGRHVDGVGGERTALDLVLVRRAVEVSVSLELLCPYTSQETW